MGFFDRNRKQLEERGIDPARLPPGQYYTDRFPVLHVGDVPSYPDLSTWSLTISGLVEQEVTLTWDELVAQPSVELTFDIHCVTKWTKLGTAWTGVSVDTLLDGLGTEAAFATAWSDGGYTTNLSLEDLSDGRAWLVHSFDGAPLEAEHGGPARLLVPHLYFWKSAKWVRGLTLTAEDEPGFWEAAGYHNRGDPWREQRYWSD